MTILHYFEADEPRVGLVAACGHVLTTDQVVSDEDGDYAKCINCVAAMFNADND